MLQNVGYLTLNISFFLYLIFFCPQLIHNLKQKNLRELSLLMHFILCIATIADLIYGFGRDMQWQYRIVTIVSLIGLTIQHLQICYAIRNWQTLIMSFVLGSALMFSIFSVYFKFLPKELAIVAGGIAQVGIFIFTLPQIIKNYRDNTAIGVSIYFVFLTVILDVLDTISAWTLNWDWPSKVGSPFALVLALVLLRQFWLYNKPKERYAI